jgi:cytolysin-activating lysine-acyltransferase
MAKQKAEKLGQDGVDVHHGEGVSQLDQPSPAEALGQIVWLMRQSVSHKHLFMVDLDWLVMPAIQRQQFRLIRKDGNPIGYASWAYLSEEVEERMVSGEKRLGPGDWMSGEKLWLIDLVAPFGGQDIIIRELKEKVFGGAKMKTLQLAPGAIKTAVVEW